MNKVRNVPVSVKTKDKQVAGNENSGHEALEIDLEKYTPWKVCQLKEDRVIFNCSYCKKEHRLNVKQFFSQTPEKNLLIKPTGYDTSYWKYKPPIIGYAWGLLISSVVMTPFYVVFPGSSGGIPLWISLVGVFIWLTVARMINQKGTEESVPIWLFECENCGNTMLFHSHKENVFKSSLKKPADQQFHI